MILYKREEQTPEEIKNFSVKIAEKNMKTGKIFCLAIAIFEILMLIYAIIIKKAFSLTGLIYIFSYLTLLLISILCLIIINKNKKANYKYFNLINIVTACYSIFFIIWGILISVLDMKTSNINSIVFLTIIMGLASTIIFKPKIIISIFSSSFIVYVIAIILVPWCEFSVSVLINLLVFIIIAILICYNKYFTCYTDFKHQSIIENNNKKLNEMYIKQAETNEKLKYASCTDALTGVNNRWGLHYMFDNIINECYLNKKNLCVMMFDLDDFKSINDKFGHKAGDESLIRVASIFKKNIDSKYIFRYGGEEFIVVLIDKNADDAYSLAEKIRLEIENEKIQAIKITISGGIYLKIPINNSDSDEYLIGADKALYTAKTSGKNKIIMNT
jgi:diguanylate cyclase (GGDEF)-like protein